MQQGHTLGFRFLEIYILYTVYTAFIINQNHESSKINFLFMQTFLNSVKIVA